MVHLFDSFLRLLLWDPWLGYLKKLYRNIDEVDNENGCPYLSIYVPLIISYTIFEHPITRLLFWIPVSRWHFSSNVHSLCVDYKNGCFPILYFGVTSLWKAFTDYSCALISTCVWLIAKAIDLPEVLTCAETHSETSVRCPLRCFCFPHFSMRSTLKERIFSPRSNPIWKAFVFLGNN